MRLRVYPRLPEPVVLRLISRLVWPPVYMPGPQSGEPIHPSDPHARMAAGMPKDSLKILLRAVNLDWCRHTGAAQRPVSRNRTSSVSRAELSLSSHSHTVSTCQPASSSRRR
jgi:hypothetical protein